MNTTTHDHEIGKSPGQTITAPNHTRTSHDPKQQSRFRRFPWSHNHADNHADHAETITLGRVSLKRDPSPLASGAPR